MRIKDELLHLAHLIPGIHTVKYQSDFEANFNNTIEGVNDIDFPFLQIVALETGALELNPSGTRYLETWNILCFLCTKTEFDSNTAENQDLIEQHIKPHLLHFIDAINTSDKFQPMGRINYKQQHLKYDYFITGMLAIFSLTERVGTPIC